jgi:hypothetical protein
LLKVKYQSGIFLFFRDVRRNWVGLGWWSQNNFPCPQNLAYLLVWDRFFTILFFIKSGNCQILFISGISKVPTYVNHSFKFKFSNINGTQDNRVPLASSPFLNERHDVPLQKWETYLLTHASVFCFPQTLEHSISCLFSFSESLHINGDTQRRRINVKS